MRVAPIPAIVDLPAAAAGGYAYRIRQGALRVPTGLARVNGRVEVERVDVATEYAGRIAELRVNEGSAIEKQDILARTTPPNLSRNWLEPKLPRNARTGLSREPGLTLLCARRN